MNIKSAQFIKGVVEDDEILNDTKPQIAFIGRSNAGKSSLINVLTGNKNLAKTSSFPGRTQEINIFLINKELYFVDLPGYGFAKASKETQEKLQNLIHWYLFNPIYEQKKVVMIIDAEIGLTNTDMQMLYSLNQENKNVIIAANKIDKIKSSQLQKQLKNIQEQAGKVKVMPVSAEKKSGISELLKEIL